MSLECQLRDHANYPLGAVGLPEAIALDTAGWTARFRDHLTDQSEENQAGISYIQRVRESGYAGGAFYDRIVATIDPTRVEAATTRLTSMVGDILEELTHPSTIDEGLVQNKVSVAPRPSRQRTQRIWTILARKHFWLTETI